MRTSISVKHLHVGVERDSLVLKSNPTTIAKPSMNTPKK
jgi:hypothetical protein